MKANQHITFQELCQYANEFFQDHPSYATQFSEFAPQAVMVFKQETFKQEYSLESRSYKFSLANKFFLPDIIGNSLFGSALDGSDNMVRLDWYMGQWEVDYCYLLPDPNTGAPYSEDLTLEDFK